MYVPLLISFITIVLQYADRDPIGLERVIKTVTAKRVQEFYHRWYAPQNMAVVAVGDFPSTEVIFTNFILRYGLFVKCAPTTAGNTY